MDNSQNPNPGSTSFHNKLIVIFLGLFFVVTIVAIVILLTNNNYFGSAQPKSQQLMQTSGGGILSPKGPIAAQQKTLIITAILLMLVAVIPAFVMLAVVVYKYRAGKNNSYTPDWENNATIKFIIWALPSLVILALAVIIWKSSPALDPYKPIISNVKPITIQVVALQWKWLFIYPDENIATVNYIEFPEKTPINFQLTADAPMNSFWIPQLGGQMYAMAGMKTQLHLMADQQGEFAGRAAEISGQGFAGMKFMAKASSQADFDQWVRSVRQGANVLDSENDLDMNEYNRLSQPSENNPVVFYASTEKNLYNSVIMKFMAPAELKDNKDTRIESKPGMNY